MSEPTPAQRDFAPRDGEVVTVRPKSSSLTKQNTAYFTGVSGNTAQAVNLAMHLVVIPPGGRAKPHYHLDFETAIYVLEGQVETRYGLNFEKSSINGPGDFVFIPPFVPHYPVNMSDTEPARAIIARNDSAEHERVVLYDGRD